VRATELGPGTGALSRVVPAGRPFGALLPAGSPWALVSCVVSPGFQFSEWRLEALTPSLRARLSPADAALLAPLAPPEASA
jgi:predicted cupin superfamily sugar epimerase